MLFQTFPYFPDNLLCFSLQLSRARGMGGGLNHLSLLLEFTQINQNNRNTLSLAHGVWTTDVKSTILYISGWLSLGHRQIGKSCNNTSIQWMPLVTLKSCGLH